MCISSDDDTETYIIEDLANEIDKVQAIEAENVEHEVREMVSVIEWY